MSRRKVAVIGSGNVGATTAQLIVQKGLADCVMIDIIEGMPQGKALDLSQSTPLEGADVRVEGSNDFARMEGCDIVVITAGLARTPGMSREDLAAKNNQIVRGVAQKIKQVAPRSIVIVVSNPLDIMTSIVWRETSRDDRRVMGMAGVLDSARFRFFIAQKLGVSVKEVSAMVLGGHGDLMVPLERFATVSGIPIHSFLSPKEIAPLIERTRDGGAEVVKLLKQGSAFYAPAASVAIMVESILKDEKQLLPCCVRVNGEYGLKDVFCGVPVILGREGVERIVELDLTQEELAALHKSAESVRKGMLQLK
ncbi:MAG: malate dehydrogenase [Candidatus Omnitrophica bacterium]|nr:malate dehydrogenase [Candidatus Omnitrophota bacterium]